MDKEDVADKEIMEVVISLLCQSCRSKKWVEDVLEAVIEPARRRRQEMKESQRRMEEAEKHFNRLITQLENKNAGR